jgi:hypothetical protein
MYTPNYNSALFILDTAVSFEVDYSAYVSGILCRKHYGQTRKYRR